MPTYDPTTPIGQARILGLDSDQNNVLFDDDAWTAFLNLNAGAIRLAAATAVDVIAHSEVLLLKKIKTISTETDAPAEAKALLAYSTELRRQEYQGSGTLEGTLDYAEMVVDPFSLRERMVKQWLREEV